MYEILKCYQTLWHLVNLLVKQRDARTLRTLLSLDDASMLSRPLW